MKIGIENKIESDNVTVSSTVTAISGKNEINIVSKNALEIWQVEEGAVTLTIDFTTAIEAQLICLFNVICETSVKIETYSAVPALIEDKTITASELTGLQILNTFFELTSATPIKQIKLIFSGATSTFLTSTGSIWAGDIINIGCVENIIPRDMTTDQATISRGQTADIKEDLDHQDYDFTTNKDNDFVTVRDTFFRPLIRAGWFTPRPFIIDEPKISPTNIELLFAIFDAPQIQYDGFAETTEFLTQATLGITEVFGQNDS